MMEELVAEAERIKQRYREELAQNQAEALALKAVGIDPDAVIDRFMAGPTDALREALLLECDKIVDTLLAKRHDYGTLNIKITGRYGLAVRMQDKVSRLLNLTRPGADAPAVAESVQDTYRDLIGYSLIGLVPGGWDLD